MSTVHLFFSATSRPKPRPVLKSKAAKPADDDDYVDDDDDDDMKSVKSSTRYAAFMFVLFMFLYFGLQCKPAQATPCG